MTSETTTVYAVIMADRDPSDTTLFVPADVTESPRDNVPLEDRDGNRYVGRMVSYTDTYSEASAYVRTALESGLLHDGTPVIYQGLVIANLARRPRRDATLKFAR